MHAARHRFEDEVIEVREKQKPPASLIDHYRMASSLREIDGERPLDDVTRSLLERVPEGARAAIAAAGAERARSAYSLPARRQRLLEVFLLRP